MELVIYKLSNIINEKLNSKTGGGRFGQ